MKNQTLLLVGAIAIVGFVIYSQLQKGITVTHKVAVNDFWNGLFN
jgi:hypothetical protein